MLWVKSHMLHSVNIEAFFLLITLFGNTDKSNFQLNLILRTWSFEMTETCFSISISTAIECLCSSSCKPHYTSTLVVASHENKAFSMSVFFCIQIITWAWNEANTNKACLWRKHRHRNFQEISWFQKILCSILLIFQIFWDIFVHFQEMP